MGISQNAKWQWAPSSCQRGWWGLKFGHMPRYGVTHLHLTQCWVRWWNPNQMTYGKNFWKNTHPRVYTQVCLLKVVQGGHVCCGHLLENWGSLAHWHSHLAHLWRHSIPLLGLQWDTSAIWPINSPIKQVSHHSEATKKMISLGKRYKLDRSIIYNAANGQAQWNNQGDLSSGSLHG